MSSAPNLRIVLVQTFQPENIGAVARAMKTMGLNQLYLVNPVNPVNDAARSLAAGAQDVLDNAIEVASLSDALTDCTQVFATTARQRHFSRPQRTAKEAATWISEHPTERIAIVFGRERMGLSNEDIDLAQQLIYIPANEEYGVLNLAQAVQIIAYEVFQLRAPQSVNATPNNEALFASQQELLDLYEHMENTLKMTGFLRSAHEGNAFLKLKQLVMRAHPNVKEVRMLRGLFHSIDRLTKP